MCVAAERRGLRGGTNLQERERERERARERESEQEGERGRERGREGPRLLPGPITFGLVPGQQRKPENAAPERERESARARARERDGDGEEVQCLVMGTQPLNLHTDPHLARREGF